MRGALPEPRHPTRLQALVLLAWAAFAVLALVPWPTPGPPGAMALLPIFVTAYAWGRWGGAVAGIIAGSFLVAVRIATDGQYILGGATAALLAYGVAPLVGYAAGWLFEDRVRTRRLMAELDGQRRRLQETQDRAAIGDWTLEPGTGRVAVSEQTLRLFGFEPGTADVSLDAFLERIHPEDRPRIEAAQAELTRPDDHAALEYRIVRPDGSVRWVQGAGGTQRTERGPVLYGTVQDITDRKLAEIRLRSMLDNSPDGVARFDAHGVCMHHNAAWLRLIGTSELERHGTWEADLWAQMGRALEHGTPAEFIAPRGRAPGQRMIQARIIPEDAEGQPTVLVVLTDITAAKEAEQRLRDALSTLQVVLETAPVPIMQVDDDGRIVRVNQAVEDLFRYGRDELIGQRPPMVPEGGQAAYDAALQADGPTVARDAMRIARDGTAIPVDIYCAPLPDGGGVRIEVDLRDRRELEDAQRETEKLRELDEFKTQFLNTAAHELSTPLTPIKLQLSMMQDKQHPDSGIELLTRNFRRLEMLVRDLLDAARLQSGQLNFDMDRIDLAPALKDAVRSFEPRAQAAGLILDALVEDGLDVVADDRRMEQVFFNLLSNACKFTPPGGSVHVTAGREKDEIVIAIEDSGHGMTQRQIAGLFQPFSQFHRERVGPHVGTGLGLYICKGIVEVHGGSVEVESPGVGRGATFRLRLPAARPDGPSQGPARRPPSGHATVAGPPGIPG